MPPCGENHPVNEYIPPILQNCVKAKSQSIDPKPRFIPSKTLKGANNIQSVQYGGNRGSGKRECKVDAPFLLKVDTFTQNVDISSEMFPFRL